MTHRMVDHTFVDPSPHDHTWHASALHILGLSVIPHGSNPVHVALLYAAQSMELTRVVQKECYRWHHQLNRIIGRWWHPGLLQLLFLMRAQRRLSIPGRDVASLYLVTESLDGLVLGQLLVHHTCKLRHPGNSRSCSGFLQFPSN